MAKGKEKMKKSILGAIKSGEIAMRSKVHFMLKTIAFALAVVLTFGLLIYLASFIIFLLRLNGIFLLPSFGSLGILPLMLGLPWILILLVGIFILILEILARHFSFVYRKPLIYSILGVIILVVGSSVSIAATTLHDRALQSAKEYRLPIGGYFYRHFGDKQIPWRGHTVGIIIEIGENQFTIRNREGESVIVATSTETRFPRNSNFEVGDTIVVIGTSQNTGEVLQALGVRKFDGEKNMRKSFNREGRAIPK